MLFVKNMQGISEREWDCLLAESPGGGHVLQTWRWGEFKASQGWTPLRLALMDGERVCGLAQVFLRQPLPFFGKVAYCPKGPWIDWANVAHVRVMLRGMARFAREHGACILRIESELYAGPGRPTASVVTLENWVRRAVRLWRRWQQRTTGTTNEIEKEEQDDGRQQEARQAIEESRRRQAEDGHTPGRAVFAEYGYRRSVWDMQHRTTMVVDIGADDATLLGRMKSKWRYNINLARRKGVTVVQDDTATGIALLHDIYLRTAARDNFVLRERRYFEESWGQMIAAGHAHIFFAYYEGRPLAGLLLFMEGQKAWYHVGASESEGRNVMPAHLLQFAAMQFARDHGATYYDLVAIPNYDSIGPADPMWGLYLFKYGFGGQPMEWVGSMDRPLDPRGRLWQLVESIYYRFYKKVTGELFF